MIQHETLEQGPDHWRSIISAGSFEEVLESLEAVVSRLEVGQLSLADSLEYYELGIQLTKRCEDILAEAELQVSQLAVSDDEPPTSDHDGRATDDAEGPDGPAF